MRKLPISFKISLLTILFFALAACENQEKDKAGTQVVAKVNNDEISVHQLNYVLQRTNGLTAENVELAKKKVINNLVDMSLLYQQAITDKLDRDPDIMMAVEQAKRQTLAQAWLQKATKIDNKPSASDIQIYYDQHPDLFAKHKTFKLKEVAINKEEGKQTAINDILTNTKKVDDLIKGLDEAKIPYQTRVVAQGAENLPLDQLPTMANLKEGEFISFNKDNSLLVLAVLSSTQENIDLTKASPIIEKYLVNKQHNELVEKTVKDVKDKAKIVYEGEFASLNTSASPVSAPAANP